MQDCQGTPSSEVVGITQNGHPSSYILGMTQNGYLFKVIIRRVIHNGHFTNFGTGCDGEWHWETDSLSTTCYCILHKPRLGFAFLNHQGTK